METLLSVLINPDRGLRPTVLWWGLNELLREVGYAVSTALYLIKSDTSINLDYYLFYNTVFYTDYLIYIFIQ